MLAILAVGQVRTVRCASKLCAVLRNGATRGDVYLPAMTQHDITLRDGLPTEMQILLRELPREGWQGHPHFAKSTQNWMGAHAGFRQLGGLLAEDTRAFVERQMDGPTFADRLGFVGNLLVRNLHGHHSWEDRSFFPELRDADPRFEAGLEMLETDHVALDELLDDLTRQGNRVIKLQDLDPAQMTEEAKPLADTADKLTGFLERHLTDEEDLVVPIILHHALRG